MIYSIKKAFDILELLAVSGKAYSLTELSQKTSLNQNTLRSILTTLMELGYVKQETKRGNYGLGSQVLLLSKGLSNRNALQRIMDSLLWDLHSQSGGEAVYANMVSGLQLIPIHQIESDHSLVIRNINYIGRELLPTTAQGKILLANLPYMTRKEFFLNQKIPKLASGTIIDSETIMSSLEQIREENIATNISETEEGFAAVASGVFDSDNRLVATVAVQAPQVRMPPERIELMESIVRNIAAIGTQKLKLEEDISQENL
jgi:IclR family acetate operon transcriptional repressor